MQLSPLFSALLHIHQTHRTGSLKYLGIFSASAVMLGSSPLVWAASDMTADSKEVPVAVFDTIVVNSSADASAQGLPIAYEGEQVATGSRVGLLGLSKTNKLIALATYSRKIQRFVWQEALVIFKKLI